MITQLKDLMNEKGQQVEHKKIHGQVMLAVTEIVLDMVALVFKRIESFVFNFPTSPARLNYLNDIVFTNRYVGYPTGQ